MNQCKIRFHDEPDQLNANHLWLWGYVNIILIIYTVIVFNRASCNIETWIKSAGGVEWSMLLEEKSLDHQIQEDWYSGLHECTDLEAIHLTLPETYFIQDHGDGRTEQP